MIIVVERTVREDMKGEFSINYEWVVQLSDSNSRVFNELSDIVQNVIRELLSDDAKYVKKICVYFR